MGLRRHQVENLVLRGPIFYWRARIPAGLAACGRSARLSLSLRLSDRKKASLVARRLNALLLQVEMMPAARMATKEQLTKIFALEIEAMHEEIDALDRSAKRSGRSLYERGDDLYISQWCGQFMGFSINSSPSCGVVMGRKLSLPYFSQWPDVTYNCLLPICGVTTGR